MADRNREFEKGSIILFVLMMACNIMNYFFQIILGRLLNDVVQYGTMNALLSVLNIVSLPVAVIALIVSKYVAELTKTSAYGEIKGFIKSAGKYISILVLGVVITGIIIGKPIGRYMHIDRADLLIIIIVSAAISYLIQIVAGYFQGEKNFFSYGVYNLVAPVVKIIFCLVLSMLGYRLFGISISILLSNIFAIIIGYIWLKVLFRNITEEPVRLKKKGILVFSYSAIMMNVGVTLLNNVDMLLIKHYFADDAGYYSVASVLGKLVLYFTNAIVVALFPFVVEKSNDGEGTFAMLKKALVYGTTIAVTASFALNIFSNLIIKIMYGNTYMGAEKYILPITVLVTALSVLTIIANYDLAREKSGFVMSSMLISTGIDVVLITLWHSNILSVVWILTGVLSIVTAINLVRVVVWR